MDLRCRLKFLDMFNFCGFDKIDRKVCLIPKNAWLLSDCFTITLTVSILSLIMNILYSRLWMIGAGGGGGGGGGGGAFTSLHSYRD